LDVKIVTTGDPQSPYKLKWKKWLLFWVDPPIDTDEGYNMFLDFKLKDDAKTGVCFQTPVTAAFGADAGRGGCPSAGSDAGGEIDFSSSSVSANELTICDRNRNVGDIQFAVFFSDGSKLDPIIKNSGGGT
jgi:hypothetical protein